MSLGWWVGCARESSAAVSGSGFAVALTAGPDPLHLSLVFNISHTTATHYTTVAEQLLSDELEQPVDQ